MATMEIVETNVLVACIVPTSLHSSSLLPSGKYTVRISMSVSGIVNVHSNMSEIARFTINILRGVRIAGFRTTDKIYTNGTQSIAKIEVEMYKTFLGSR